MDKKESPDANDNPAVKELELIDEMRIDHFGVPDLVKRRSTQIVPFNFEERHKLLDKKKEERIQKILEEERKAREFRAKPVPHYIKKNAINLSPFKLHNKRNDDPKLKEREGQAVAKEVARLGRKAANPVQRIKPFK